MQATAGKDENGFDVEPGKSEITAQKASKPEQPQRLRSFVAVSLYTVMFVGIFALGWVYMGNKSLTQARGEIVDGGQSTVDALDTMSEKTKLLETKITNLQSLSETCVAEHKPLAVQNQKLVEANTTRIAKNKELRVRLETLSNQFDKVNEVYLKRLAAMENVTSVIPSAAPLEAAPPVVVEREVVVSPQGQDPDEELVNENKVLAAQNEDLVRRVEELTGQLDKANKVYLKRLTAMEKPADNSALIAENKELVQMVAILDDQRRLQQELITELERQNARSVAANTVSVAEDVLVAKQETIAAKPEAEGQDQALADVNAALVVQYEELVKKVTRLNDQMDKSNEVYRRQLTERETQSATVFATTTRPAAKKVQRRWPATTPKTQGPAPWKGTSVAEMLANVRPAAKNR